MEDNYIGTSDATDSSYGADSYVPEGVPSETQATPEFDVDRVDNISQLREHVKGLKSDLDTYKSTHSFFEENFGDLENAKLAHQLYSQVLAEDFEPDSFVNLIESLSPSRARALAEKISEQGAAEVAYQKMQDLFGSEVTPEEVALFKQWRDSGYMITEEDDIPDAFKYDSYGNPLSEEQVQAFKEQFTMLNNLRSQVERQVSSVQQQQEREAEQQYYAQIQEAVNKFDDGNLKVLDDDLAKVGLSFSENDTPQAREQKTLLREFFVGGIGRLFLSKPELQRDYESALAHIKTGEQLLARRYEPRIQKGLLEILRSGPISKLMQSLTPNRPTYARPEISNSGASAPTEITGGTREERIRQLVASGALRM
jgi:hypothetical protein